MDTEPVLGRRSSSRGSTRKHNIYVTAREHRNSTIRQHRKAKEIKRRKESLKNIEEELREIEKLTQHVAKNNPLYYNQVYQQHPQA